MAEILVKAIDATHSNPAKDLRGSYKRGMPVVVMPDGHPWGGQERLPLFVVIKVPLVPVSAVLKYIEQYNDAEGAPIRRRLWQIRWADLPLAARNTLASTGMLTIKATAAYTGSFNYTWTQIKQYFRNLRTGLDETEEI
jgi:hypothetical protein